MVRIRLSRLGRTHRPFYRINAVEKRTQRNGKVLENLGWYNPMEKDETKQIHLKTERIQHWLGQGAQATDTCKDLFARGGVIDAAAWEAERMARITKRRETIAKQKEAEAEAKKAEEEAARKAAEEEAKAKAEEEAKAKAEAEAAAQADSGEGEPEASAESDSGESAEADADAESKE